MTLLIFTTQRGEWVDLDSLKPTRRRSGDSAFHPKRCGPCEICKTALADYATSPAYADRIAPLPALPHTCTTCAAHFKQGEQGVLREHRRLCATWMDRVPVVAPGAAPPPRRVPADYRGGQGYPLPSERADIWRLWVENQRRDARQLIARYGAQRPEPTQPTGTPRTLGDPDPIKLARHVQLYGGEGAERWLETPEAEAVIAVTRRRSRSHGKHRLATQAKTQKFSEVT